PRNTFFFEDPSARAPDAPSHHVGAKEIRLREQDVVFIVLHAREDIPSPNPLEDAIGRRPPQLRDLFIGERLLQLVESIKAYREQREISVVTLCSIDLAPGNIPEIREGIRACLGIFDAGSRDRVDLTSRREGGHAEASEVFE